MKFQTTQEQQSTLLEAVRRYTSELSWRLTPVRGKRPVWDGWPDYYPPTETLLRYLTNNVGCGVGINLGGSGLIDIEGDTPEGEMILDDLCEGLEFPYWRSQKSKHRLFRDHPDVGYLQTFPLKIEFRADRHQSVLPPSPHPSGCRYEWIVSPFDVSPPPLPDHIVEFYQERKKQPGNKRERKARGPKPPSFPYRDNFDYVLRHFDLMAEARNLGIEFAVREPDENGNIPCYVPAALRDGKQDDHPSGVFNIRNGVLRDFATGKNHIFFRMMSALTGEPWPDIFKRWEKKAGAQHGRPHSRRITPRTPMTRMEQMATLDEARQELSRYFETQLARPPRPKTLNIVKGLPGLGKTYGMCKVLAEKSKRAVILTLENELANTHVKTLKRFGGNAGRMPVLRQSPCPHPDEYEATSRRGFQPSQGLPCQNCDIGPKRCSYLHGFSGLNAADQLCCAAIYHTHTDFYDAYGNDTRPIVVFDENCVDLLIAPKSNSIQHWLAWAELLMKRLQCGRADAEMKSHIISLLQLVSWLEQMSNEFAATTDDQRRPVKFKPFLIPDHVRCSKIKKSPALASWLQRQAFKKEHRHIPNLYEAAIHLLMQVDGSVLFERIEARDGDVINVRFRMKHPLPEEKEVFILDATANEELIRALAPGWDIKVYDPPKVEQKGHVVQIMDYDVSRNFITKQVRSHRDHNPSWLVQVIDNILDQHGPAALISFKKATKDPTPEFGLIKKLTNAEKITTLHNFPCRGHTFDDQCLIVLGTPYKDEATIWELALAVYGFDGLPKSKYTRQARIEDHFVAGNMGYDESHLQPIQDFLITAELVQGIGRVRPLQNECSVFVITNAKITDWDIEQFMASEMFDLRPAKRKDFADNYKQYVDQCFRQIEEQGSTTNPQVCKRLDLHPRRGRDYLKQMKHDYREVVVQNGRNLSFKQSSTTRTDR